MVTDIFGALLSDLGRLLSIPDLKPDKNNCCLIKLPSDARIQLEISKDGDNLIVTSEIGFVTPGRYRIDVFREALKTNTMPLPHWGIFAWSKKADVLIFYKKIPLKDLTAEKIASFIPSFAEIAMKWKDAIARGEVPVVATVYTSPKGGGLFSLIK